MSGFLASVNSWFGIEASPEPSASENSSVDSVGAARSSGLDGPRHGRSGSVLMRPSELASPLLALLANPFSLTVLGQGTDHVIEGEVGGPIVVMGISGLRASAPSRPAKS